MEEHAAVKENDKVLAALAACGRNVVNIDERTWGQIKKVETAILEEAELHRKAKVEAKHHMLSIDSISKKSGISRQTFYNKGGLLADYTQQRRKDEGVATDNEVAESLRRRLEEVGSKLTKMTDRDAQFVALYAENVKLKNQVKRLMEFTEDIPTDLAEEIEAIGQVIPFSSLGYTLIMGDNHALDE